MSEVNTVVVVNKGHLMPEEFRQKMLENHTTALGLAVPNGEDIITWSIQSNEYDLGETMATFEKEYKEHFRYYCFQGGDNISPQPFEVLTVGEGEEQQRLLVVMADGEFTNQQGEAEYVNEGFMTQLQETLDLSNDDFDRLIELLNKKEFKAKIEKDFGPRSAVFVIVPPEDKSFCVSNVKNGFGYPWGMTTKHMGYGQPVQQSVPTVGKKLVLNKKPVEGQPPPEQKPEEKKEVDPQDVAILKDKTSTFSKKNGVLWVSPPKNGNGKNPLDSAKTFWNTHCTETRPTKESHGVPAWQHAVMEGFPFSKLKATSPLHDAWGRLMGNEPKKADADILPPEKKEEEEKKPTAGFSTLIDVTKKDNFLKWQNEGGLPIIGDDELKAFAGKYPPATAQLGIKYDDLLHMKPEAYARIVHGDRHIAISILNEMRFRQLGMIEEQKVEQRPQQQVEGSTARKLVLPQRKTA